MAGKPRLNDLAIKIPEEFFGGAGEFHFGSAPLEADAGSMEGLVGQNELGALLGGESAFDEGEVAIFVGAIDFIADDGVAGVGEVDADLVFAAGLRPDVEEGIGLAFAGETLLDGVFGDGGGAVRADAVFDYDGAFFIFAEGTVQNGVIGGGPAVDDGEIFFFDGAGFPTAAEFAGGGGVFGNDDHAAGFAVEPVYEVGRGAGQVQAGAADEAGVFVTLGGMADEVGGLVDDQQVGIFKEDFKEGVHFSLGKFNRKEHREHIETATFLII